MDTHCVCDAYVRACVHECVRESVRAYQSNLCSRNGENLQQYLQLNQSFCTIKSPVTLLKLHKFQ